MDYFLDLAANPDAIADAAPEVYRRVWRHDFSAPGFCLVRLGPSVDSHRLRAGMVALKGALSDLHHTHAGVTLVYRSMARFDQQETTKFHLDGAPEESLLMLGYEPTAVASNLAMADYSRAAALLGIAPARFLSEYNPMFRKGEQALADFITHLDRADWTSAQVLVVNNSSAPFDPAAGRPQGVMHQATIPHPDPSRTRIINSTMIVTASDGPSDSFEPDRVTEFVRTTAISPRLAY